MQNLITSQHHIDGDIVAAKKAAKDYSISVSPEFEVDGVKFRVLLDGHHSLEAALEDGVEPDVNELTASEDDRIGQLERSADDFLSVCHHDGDYIFAVSKKFVW